MPDRRGGKFIEQIVPGTFKKALERAENVRLLLNHDKSRDLGGTDSNLKLTEDTIGLRAIAEITDPEVIQKAKDKKLRGWSFGFYEKEASEEETKDGIKRRFVEDMDLLEVSLIDDRKNPCYAGTSVQMRADDEISVETRGLETEGVYTEQKKPVDYSNYEKIIKNLGGNI
ncbi:MAG: HK97 family phage prohead protease [Lachnospiraceae bacterium]